MEKYEINHDKKTITIKKNVFESADATLMKKIHRYHEIGYEIDVVDPSKKKAGIKLEDIKKDMASDKEALKTLEGIDNYFKKLKFYREWKNNKK